MSSGQLLMIFKVDMEGLRDERGLMSEFIELNLSGKTRTAKTLVLSTWFLSYLHEGRGARGLPNDFLTKAPGALLLYDHILCDKEAFDAEARAAKKGGWITSEIFVRLKEEGVLLTVDFKDLIPQDFWESPQTKSVRSSALELMAQSLAKLKKQTHRPHRLPPELTNINEHLFKLGLDVQGLKYNWQEKLLKVSSSVDSKSLPRETALPKAFRRLLSFGSFDVQLIPPPSKQGLRAAKKVYALESNILMRSICGDPELNVERIHDFRFSEQFKDLDRIIDQPERKSLAVQNLEKILKARSGTKDVREAMQVEISKVLAGDKTARDVKTEIDRQCLELLQHCPSVRSLGRELAWEIGVPGAEIALDAAKEFGKAVPVLGHALAAAEVLKAGNDLRERRELIQTYPLGHFLAIAAKAWGKSQ
jgi:hypothetical protein